MPRVSIFTQSMVLLPVSFLRLADGQHWPGVSREGGEISSNHWKVKDSLFEECEGFSWLSFLRKQLNTKKQMKPKLTSNQTKNHELQFQRQTATRSSLFLSWLLVPQFLFLIWFEFFFFLMLKLFVFSFWFCFVFLNYSSFEPHKNGSVAPGSPPEGRKNSLAMYKKKSKLNQKCCSWCLFYTVVLLAFLLL